MCLAALATLTLSPALGRADGPTLPPSVEALADAAHDLTLATHDLAQLLGTRGPMDRLSEDAQALEQAAAHFEEDLTVGPRLTKSDFDPVEQAFDETREDFRSMPNAEQDPTARRAWSQIVQLHGRLRLAWFAHWTRHTAPPPPAFPSGPPDSPLPR
jgi:hypothetical protein